MATRIIMPQLGESVVEGTISKWLKKEGDPVEEMESLLEINTDKVDSEIPSPAKGTVLKILIPEGETVRAGTIIAWVGQPGEQVAGDQAPGGQAQDKQSVEKPAKSTGEVVGTPSSAITASPGDGVPGNGPVVIPAPGRSRELGFISPIVARMAQENQIDLSQVTGTGEGGRITKKDVLAFIEQQPAGKRAAEKQATTEPAPWETPGEGDLFRPTEMVFAKGRPGTTAGAVVTPPGAPAQPEAALPTEGRVIPHTKMRSLIAEHMVTSKRTSPHVTTVMEADLHRVIAHYNANKEAFARDGARLTYTAYFASAAVQALRAFPLVNSSWRDDGVLLHPQINLGMAVSLGEEGLIVPVIKRAEQLSLLGLASAIGDLANRARSHKLSADEVRGGTFTITNHGISGSLFATPIINQPQCAILGVGAIQKRVVVVEDQAGGDSMAIRPMAYLSLTFDHRILDGASADGYLAKVVETLENWS